jgi:anti-sigma factor RsiW
VQKAGQRRDGPAISFVGVAGDLTCRQFVELVTDYLERVLAEEQMGQVRRHLLTCEGCAVYLAQMRATILALGALRAM